MKKIIFLLIITSFLFEFKTLSQNNVEDSLLIELNNTEEDTIKVNVLMNLFDETSKYDTDKSLKYSEKALKLAEGCNYNFGIGRAYLGIGDVYYKKGDYKSANDYYNKSLVIFNNLKNKEKISLCYNRMGQLSTNSGEFDEAFNYYNKSLETIQGLSDKSLFATVYLQIGNLNFYKGDYYETLKNYRLCLTIAEEINKEELVSSCLMNIGSVNANFGNYSEALKYYQKALVKSKQLNDKAAEADCSNNIGLVHSLLGNYSQALRYYQVSIKMYKKLDYKIGLINSYVNIGQVFQNTNEHNKAINSFENALSLANINNDRYNIFLCYSNIGSVYLNLKEYTKAEAYYLKSLEISKELNDVHGIALCQESLAKIQLKYNKPKYSIELALMSLKNSRSIGVKTVIRDAYKLLSEAHETLNNKEKALEYFKLYKTMHDSVFSSENSEQISIMETIYQTEKKQQQIELQETQIAQQDAEIEKQKTLRNALFGGLGAIFIIVILVGYAYVLKKKANKKIEAQKDEIEKQKGVIEKKNVHITDSINYAKRIQESVFISGNEMKRHFQDSFLLNQPKDIVSGDFFWFTEINNKKIFAVVDCTGHGVPGAFMSLIGNSLLNEIVKEKKILEPSEILTALHVGVISVLRQDTEQSKANDGMDMVICMYDEKKKELQFSGARNFMYLKNGKELEILEGDSFSIGEIPHRKDLEVKFNTQAVKINDETKIYLMTDGYMDQFGGEKLKKFNQGPFEEMLKEILHLPMQEQKEKMLQTFTDWKGSYKQIDDVMILGISLS